MSKVTRADVPGMSIPMAGPSVSPGGGITVKTKPVSEAQVAAGMWVLERLRARKAKATPEAPTPDSGLLGMRTGAANQVALAGFYKARGGEVTPSASLALRTALRGTDVVKIAKSDGEALETWLKEALKGCKLERGLGLQVMSVANMLISAGFTAKDMEGLCAGLRDMEGATGLSDLSTAWTDAAGGISDAGEFFSLGFDNLPVLGIIVSYGKAAWAVKEVISECLNSAKQVGLAANSLSVLEHKALCGAAIYTDRRIGNATADAAAQSGKAAAQVAELVTGIPVGVAAGLALGLANMTRSAAENALADKEAQAFNAAVARGSMNVKMLAEMPTIALYLPYLPGVTALHLLGIVGPGWEASDHPEQAEQLWAHLVRLQQGMSESLLGELKVLQGGSLKGGAAAAAASALPDKGKKVTKDAKDSNPWRPELERLEFLLMQCNMHAWDAPFKLVNKTDPIHMPAPQEISQKAKQAGFDAAFGALEKISNAVDNIGKSKSTTDIEPFPSGT